MNLKRIIVPAFFVIDLRENEVDKADEIADQMRSAANNLHFANAPGAACLMLDEERPNRVFPIVVGAGEEYPHTYPEVDTEQADGPTCVCGSRIFNEKGDCQICGL